MIILHFFYKFTPPLCNENTFVMVYKAFILLYVESQHCYVELKSLINKGFLLFMSTQKYCFHLYFNKKLCYARYGIKNTFKMEQENVKMKINISTIIEAIEMADDNFTFFLSDKNNISFNFFILLHHLCLNFQINRLCIMFPHFSITSIFLY